MPIDYSKYPADWNDISKRIRERAGQKCECGGECGHTHNRRCNAPNNTVIWRDGSQWWNLDSFPETDEKTVNVLSPAATYQRSKVKVILTVAHLNHTPSDCRDENLKAFCQFCHLNYDIEHHKKNAAATRRKKKLDDGQMELTE